MIIAENISCNGSEVMSVRDFDRLRNFIYRKCGINITDSKKIMLEVRLRKRLKKLNINSFSQYCDYLFSQDGAAEELTEMIDQVTTNKTDFFREPSHFEYLKEKALPDLCRIKRDIIIWSAGCASGEEPYTLAMVLSESRCSYQIFATDISTRVLEKARVAVYDWERVQAIPNDFRTRYLLSNKDKSKLLYRIVPELRNHVIFKRLNFMDESFGFVEKMDIIFCRNVIIYFDKPTQEKILRKICSFLMPHGYLFMGHSETLFGMNLPLVQVVPTIYRKKC